MFLLDIIGIDFGHLVFALTEVAVADEDSINVVGQWIADIRKVLSR